MLALVGPAAEQPQLRAGAAALPGGPSVINHRKRFSVSVPVPGAARVAQCGRRARGRAAQDYWFLKEGEKKVISFLLSPSGNFRPSGTAELGSAPAWLSPSSAQPHAQGKSGFPHFPQPGFCYFIVFKLP